jgi:Fe-S-cluster containining protein
MTINLAYRQQAFSNLDEMEKICIACQECCKWLTFILTEPSEDLLNAYKVRNCISKPIDGRWHIMVPNVCSHLKEAGCDIYADRPKVCREYDGRYDPAMHNTCKLPL